MKFLCVCHHETVALPNFRPADTAVLDEPRTPQGAPEATGSVTPTGPRNMARP
jgi:hypothetical protein